MWKVLPGGQRGQAGSLDTGPNASFPFPRDSTKLSLRLSFYMQAQGSNSEMGAEENAPLEQGLSTLRTTVINHQGGAQPEVSAPSEPPVLRDLCITSIHPWVSDSVKFQGRPGPCVSDLSGT